LFENFNCFLARCWGAADHTPAGAEPDVLLIEPAARLIVRAHTAALLTDTFDLLKSFPGAQPLVDLCRSHPKSFEVAVQRISQGSPAPVDIGEGNAEGSEGDEAQSRWRAHLTRAQLADLILDVARTSSEPAPAEATTIQHNQVSCRIVAVAWSVLSDSFPGELSPRVARIKTEVGLPGVDPWLGGRRDFIKAAWLCELLADRIDQRCDLSIAEASRESGVDRGVILMACKKPGNTSAGCNKNSQYGAC
jgi:hypothetical protein